MFGFLAPLYKVRFPKVQLQEHLKQLFNLCRFCDDILTSHFSHSLRGKPILQLILVCIGFFHILLMIYKQNHYESKKLVYYLYMLIYNTLESCSFPTIFLCGGPYLCRVLSLFRILYISCFVFLKYCLLK